MICYKYDESGYYIGEQQCQKDPLESKIKGKDVWLLPANATFKKPLEPKDKFKVKFNGETWEYEEIIIPSEPEYIPSFEEIEFQVRTDRNQALRESDIKMLADNYIKLSEEEKRQWSDYRQYLRDIPNELFFPYIDEEKSEIVKILTFDEFTK